MVTFDIKFLYKLLSGDEVEVQPLDNKVQVIFDYSNNSEFKQAEDLGIEVYHINDKDENGEKVAQ
jgi:hypothetical protein